MEPSTSPAKSLNKTDWKKGLRGFLITLLAGVLIVVLQGVITVLTGCDVDVTTCPVEFGNYTVLLTPIISAVGFLLEMARRWKADNA